MKQRTSNPFINPYNFIPLSKKRADADNTEQDTYSGKIHYVLLTRTPLFIPNTSNDNIYGSTEEKHKTYDFFTYKDLSNAESGKVSDLPPVIPGSEIRGMLRSNFEILTNSCLSSVDNDMVLSKRINVPFKAGLIKRETAEDGTPSYDLYKAETSKLFQYIENPKDGKKVSISNKEEGYIKKGKKWKIFKVASGKGAYRKNISLDTLEKVLKEYKKHKEGAYKAYEDEYRKFCEGSGEEYFPVYFDEIHIDSDERLMLSPACITREIYERDLREMLGSYNPCTDKENLCPACALFGTVVEKGKDNDNEAFAKTSRIRFSDLICKTKREDWYMPEQKVVLPPLLTPQLNNLEFYLKRPEGAVFWTYDYYVDENGCIHKNEEGINGRKFYWHQKNVALEKKKDKKEKEDKIKESKLNKTIRPVQAGCRFEGDLYFRDLSKEELNQLIFLLNTGEESGTSDKKLGQKKHGYKLGAAKPLGLGSVVLSVTKVLRRKIEQDPKQKTINRTEQPYGEYEKPEFDEEIEKNFMEMTKLEAIESSVASYPTIGEGKPVYEWFKENRINARNRRKMAFKEYMEPMTPELESVMSKDKETDPPKGGKRRD